MATPYDADTTEMDRSLVVHDRADDQLSRVRIAQHALDSECEIQHR